MIETFKVRVTKDHLIFCAGHFISYEGDKCERLHGHNYRTAVEVEAPLDPNHYVFDFLALLDLTRALVAELDHRMLLPNGAGLIRVEPEGANWKALYKDRSWSFPRDECVILPVPNTTTELIAAYLCDRLCRDISSRGLVPPRVIRVEVEENVGQSATYEWRPA